MDRRRLMTGTAGLIGSLAAVSMPWGRRVVSRAAQTPVPVSEVKAVGAELSVGDAVELRPGFSVRLVGVTRDNRCPADVQCVTAGSADASLEFNPTDERQNTRTSDQTVEFPLGRRVLVYDTDAFAVVADLSGDSDVAEADLVLPLYLVELEDNAAR